MGGFVFFSTYYIRYLLQIVKPWIILCVLDDYSTNKFDKTGTMNNNNNLQWRILQNTGNSLIHYLIHYLIILITLHYIDYIEYYTYTIHLHIFWILIQKIFEFLFYWRYWVYYSIFYCDLRTARHSFSYIHTHRHRQTH